MISRAVLIGWNADPTLAYLRAKLDDASTKYDYRTQFSDIHEVDAGRFPLSHPSGL
jgi:hypothetical protein